jgi:hypothetical protein
MLDMARRGPQFIYTQEWMSDPWLARNAKRSMLQMLAPVWDPPEGLSEWPTLGVRAVIAHTPHPARRSNHQAFLDSLAGSRAPAAPDAGRAVDRFFAMQAAITRRQDPRMVQVGHVLAWLGTAVGHLLQSVALTPPDHPEELVRLTLDRLELPRRIGLASARVNHFEDLHLELLYNSRVTPDGRIKTSAVRIGQGEEWQVHWEWLSGDVDAAATLESLHLAASLMCCPPLVEGLLEAVRSGDVYVRTLAVAVVRRWLLTLKAMCWLEAAVGRSWADVRAKDLACFAFNATKPDWPRRVIGISHRSTDAKRTLFEMKLWREGRCAIDAKYVPSWETNTGMVWGLFAATPAIVRVGSPGYAGSTWCRREAELVEYLVERSDFLSERWVLDLDHDRLNDLDRLAIAWDDRDAPAWIATPGLSKGFPPLCMVWTPTEMPRWEVKMLRAAGAVRVINVFVSDPVLANELARLLISGAAIPGLAPTNDPGGWPAYASILREAGLVADSDDRQLAVRLPDNYAPEQQGLDVELAERIPDLSTGTPKLGDVLVALEWFRVELLAQMEERHGDFVAIDCRRWSKQDWEADDRLSLLRGLCAIRLPWPLWVLQSAGQSVETWPLISEHPVFTQYLPDQYAWMMQISSDRRGAQALYPEDSGLILSEGLRERCSAGGDDLAGP